MLVVGGICALKKIFVRSQNEIIIGIIINITVWVDDVSCLSEFGIG